MKPTIKQRLSSYTSAFALVGAFAALPMTAQADDLLDQLDTLAAPILASDGTITHYGVTLYGTVDIGLADESHGVPSNDYWAQGTDFLVSKSGNKNEAGLVQSVLSPTAVGLKGKEDVVDGLSIVFKLETGYNPLSGDINDGLKSLTENAGTITSASRLQNANNDSSLAGQVFNRAAWGGVSNPVFGQLSFGRHVTPLADAVVSNDPFAGSSGFSLVGFSGTAQGGGATEDARLDQSLRYSNVVGPFRIALLYQAPDNTLRNGGDDAYQANLGFDYQDLTVDAVYAQKNDAVTAAALCSTAAGSSCTATKGGSITEAINDGYDPNKSVAATFSNNTTYAFFSTYKPISSVKTFVGYEYVHVANPTNSGNITQTNVEQFAGYHLIVSTSSTTAYARNEDLQYIWTGAKYDLTKDLAFTLAYYHEIQNNYDASAITAAAGSTTSHTAGQENVVSAAADYQLTKRFDVYGGFAWSQVGGGLDNANSNAYGTGYNYNNNLTFLAGGRFRF